MPPVSNLSSSAASTKAVRGSCMARPRQLVARASDAQGAAAIGAGRARRRRTRVPKMATSERISVDTALESSILHMADSLKHDGFAFCPSSETFSLLSEVAGEDVSNDTVFRDSWKNLRMDPYMGDGGKYRTRRHAHYSTHADRPETPERVPYRPLLQSKAYNPLNGGQPRYFAEVEDSTHDTPTLHSLLEFSTRVVSEASGKKDWHVEMHQLHVDTNSTEVGNITPEGKHQDGGEFVVIFLTHRENVSGGLTTIYDMELQPKSQLTLVRPYDFVMVNDREVFHGVEPIFQTDPGREAFRGVLVLLFTSKSSDLFIPWPPEQ